MLASGIGRVGRRGGARLSWVAAGVLLTLIGAGLAPAAAQEPATPGAGTEVASPSTGSDRPALSAAPADEAKSNASAAPDWAAEASAAAAADPPAEDEADPPAPPPTKVPAAPFNGSFTQRFALTLPAFHGLEPKLALAYDSSGGARSSGYWSGLAGVGMRVAGLSDIVRGTHGGGTPRFAADDVYRLDGDELVACTAAMASPACCRQLQSRRHWAHLRP